MYACVDGPTETTIWSSSYLVPPTGAPAAMPIGRPVSETAFYLADCSSGALREVPGFEAEGELLIGGVGVAAGYLHAPDLTKEVATCSISS